MFERAMYLPADSRGEMVNSIDEGPYPNSILPFIDREFFDESEFGEMCPILVGYLGATVNAGNEPIGFWRRQFQSNPTFAQRKFDWLVGVILPVICFAFDPIVFKTEGGLLNDYSTFANLGSYVAVMSMMAWLLWGKGLASLTALVAGLFFSAAIVSFAIGIFLFPFSLIGLIVIVGALGFVPFFLSFSLLRNSVRAYRSAESYPAWRTGLFWLGGLGSILSLLAIAKSI